MKSIVSTEIETYLSKNKIEPTTLQQVVNWVSISNVITLELKQLSKILLDQNHLGSTAKSPHYSAHYSLIRSPLDEQTATCSGKINKKKICSNSWYISNYFESTHFN